MKKKSKVKKQTLKKKVPTKKAPAEVRFAVMAGMAALRNPFPRFF